MGLVIGILLLFIISAITPMTLGHNVRVTDKEEIVENYNRYLYPEFYDCYNASEIPKFVDNQNTDESQDDGGSKSEVSILEKTAQSLNGPMDSPWPMYCHNARHTGRSPYNTVDTWDEIWTCKVYGTSYHCAPVIDSEGVIYVGRGDLYAIYPNGTVKWKFDYSGWSETAPALDENGIVYIGTSIISPTLFAVFTSNGTTKWEYFVGNHIDSSPVIGDDGTIYISDWNGDIHAIYPNGTSKWMYHTGDVCTSSPAIGLDGTIYVGSHDNYVYALYPNNGTLKWKYNTGSWVHGSATIGDDGTVYIGSDNSLLYAFYPNNGTVKWEVSIGPTWCSPALDEYGTLYVGVFQERFYAINSNGTIKWTYVAPGRIWFGASAALSADGFIYFGTTWMDGGEGAFIVLNPDGSERWKIVGGPLFETSPAIGQDGTVYACSSSETLHAFGRGPLEADANGPYFGLINEPVQFTGSSKGGISPHFYHWTFHDGSTSTKQNPIYNYTSIGNYSVKLTVTDSDGNTSTENTWVWIQESNFAPDKPIIKGRYRVLSGVTYNYKFKSIDPEDYLLWYYIDWDDDTSSGWIGPYHSGVEITVPHSYTISSRYSIRAKAKDGYGAESSWGELTVNIPSSKATTNSLLLWFLERFPLLEEFISRIINP